MIECPFCNEHFSENDLVYEFNWGVIANHYYNQEILHLEPAPEFKDRNIYIRFSYNSHRRPIAVDCTTAVNQQKHPRLDPLVSDKNGWSKVVTMLKRKRIFEVECDDEDPSLPVMAKFMPLLGRASKQQRIDSGYLKDGVDGMSTGIFCPKCEQLLKPEVLKAKTEVRILLAGRPGSGKTVYVTQAISELLQGRLAEDFKIEAANIAVHKHYISNKERLKISGKSFVLATNPGIVQEPYIYLLHNDKSTIRFIEAIAQSANENISSSEIYKRIRNHIGST